MRKDSLTSALHRGSKGTHKPGTVTPNENFKSLGIEGLKQDTELLENGIQITVSTNKYI